MKTSKQYNIAIIFPNWYSFLNDTMESILAIHSIRSHCRFLNIVCNDFDQPVKFPNNYKPDGILVSYDDDLCDAPWLDKLGVPVVNIFNSLKKSHPSIGMDFRSVVRTAVEHFTQLNFEKIGFLGTSGSVYTQEFNLAFEEECAARDIPFWSINLPDGIDPGEWSRLEKEAPELKEKLLNPGGRTGIFTTHDVRGRVLIDFCTDLGVNIPRDVGVLGRFDTLAAKLSTPELSSIVAPTAKIGAQAMQLLINLIEGGEVENQHIQLEVNEIRVRASTVEDIDTDMIVLQARSIIRENACSGLTVDELVQSLSIKRSSFEKRYRTMTGSSPALHIREIRVEKARQLLLTTKRSVDEIASNVGFTDARPFVVFFKREIGETPGEFRKKFAK